FVGLLVVPGDESLHQVVTLLGVDEFRTFATGGTGRVVHGAVGVEDVLAVRGHPDGACRCERGDLIRPDDSLASAEVALDLIPHPHKVGSHTHTRSGAWSSSRSA